MNNKFQLNLTTSRKQFFPFQLQDNITIDIATGEEFQKVCNKYFDRLFPDSIIDPDLEQGMNSRKVRLKPLIENYQDFHSEKILIYNQKHMAIGWLCGGSKDPYTFYMRNTGIIKSYQGRKIYTQLLDYFLKYIKALGYERISSQHLGTNKGVLIPKLKYGFEICGLELHESYGAMVNLVYHFHKDRKRVYYRKYGHIQI